MVTVTPSDMRAGSRGVVELVRDKQPGRVDYTFPDAGGILTIEWSARLGAAVQRARQEFDDRGVGPFGVRHPAGHALADGLTG